MYAKIIRRNEMIEWLSVEELSKMIKIDRQTLYRMCKNKQIPYSRFGYNYRFDRAKIMEWIQRNSHEVS